MENQDFTVKQEFVRIYNQGNKRIMVATEHLRKEKFDAVITFFRTIDKRFYDAEKRKWFFPETAVTPIIEKMNTLNITVELKEYQPLVQIVEFDTEFVIAKYDFSPETYDILKNLVNAVYHRELKEWRVPNDQLSVLVNELEKRDLQYTTTDGKCDIPPAPRPKKARYEKATCGF